MPTVTRAGLAALIAAVAAPALAQTAPVAVQSPGQAPSNPGPVIAGVCVLDEQRAILGSAAGRAYTARMQQLTQQAQAEVTAQRTPIETEVRRIQALPEAQRLQPAQALQPRITALQTLERQRSAELDATQQRQVQRIITELRPVVNQVYVARGCGLMLDGASVAFANPAMNVTDQVITGLNSRLPTLTFNRETVAAQPAPAAAAARPAAAPAPQPATRR